MKEIIKKMKLRELQIKDAVLMIQWMHDEHTVKYMNTNFKKKTLEDCMTFISLSQSDKTNMNLAIVDYNDNYVGTVSLKNIKNQSAEFAIVVNSLARGKGFAKYGMKEMIRIGFEKLKLNNIYWYVSIDNKRAIKFYDNNNYKRIDIEKLKKVIPDISDDLITNFYIWYLETNMIPPI